MVVVVCGLRLICLHVYNMKRELYICHNNDDDVNDAGAWCCVQHIVHIH